MTVPWFDGPALTVEIGFASNPTVAIASTTWTDVSAYLRDIINPKRGRNSELETFQAGTFRIVLDNVDRRFDPNYTAGPYFPNVLPMRRIRFRATYNAVTYDIWSGFVGDWPQEYDYPSDAWITVDCTDGFTALSLLKLPESVYVVEIDVDNPAAWWRLGEQSGTIVIDSSGNARDGNYEGGATFNTRTGLIFGQEDNAIGFDGIDDRGNLALPAAINSIPVTLECWITADPFPSSSLSRDLISFGVASTSGWIQEFITLGIAAGSGGASDIHAYADIRTTDQLSDIRERGSSLLIAKTLYHLVAVLKSGAVFPDLYVNGVADMGGTTVGTGTIPSTFSSTAGFLAVLTTAIGGSSRYTGILDEVAVYAGDLGASRVAAHYTAGTTPWQGDTTGARIGRLLDLVAWPTGDRTIATGLSTLQPAVLARQPVLARLQEVEASEQGQLFMGADGKVVFRDRHWRFENTLAITSQGTFGDGPGELGYSNIVTDGGEQFIANHVRAQRDGGSLVDVTDATSIAKFYERLDEVIGLQNQSDLEVRDIATFRLAAHKNPIQRVTVLEVKPTANPAVLFPKVLSLDIGHRLTVKRRPQNVGAVLTYNVLIEGIEHQITVDGDWVTRFYLSAADSSASVQPLVLDDANFGILDTNVLAY